MTNGQLTKQLIKAAQTQNPITLRQTALEIMTWWPLGSDKVLYDSDKSKVPEESWKVLIEVALATDRKKMDDCNEMLKEAGLPPSYKSYGWYQKGKR